MNDIVKFNASQLPAFVTKGAVSDLAKNLAGGGAQGKRLSIKGGVFRLMVDGKEVTSIDDRHLDVVIVNAASKISRTFYAGVWDEANPTPPDCWSAAGDVPDASSKDAQSTSCATCQQNVKGSGQGDSRACRYSQRLAVVLANDIGGDVMQLSLAATSLFGKEEGDKRPLQAYARYLAAQSISPEMLVTRMRFDTSVATPKMFFQPARWLTDEEYTKAIEQGKTMDAINAITMTVSQTDGVKEKPPAIEGKKPSAKGAKPAPEPEASDEVAEPEKAKGKPKAPVVEKASTKLSSVIDQWADDEAE